MKAKVITYTLLCSSMMITSTTASAFLGELVGAMVKSTIDQTIENSKKSVELANQFNDELWEMHKNKSYSGDYMEKANWLNSHHSVNDAIKTSTYLGHLDTVAWTYMDNGYKQEALDVYEKKILPFCKSDSRLCRKYKNYYTNLKKEGNK